MNGLGKLLGGGSGHGDDHDSVIDRLREIKRWILGRDPSLVSDTNERVRSLEVRLAAVEALLADTHDLVVEIHEAVGEPDLDVSIAFGPPIPK